MLSRRDLKRPPTLPTLPTNWRAQFAAWFFVGNVGYPFSIANIANKPTAARPCWRLVRAGWHGRMLASACVGIANIANDRLPPGQVSDR
jgi:hypothetical protein